MTFRSRKTRAMGLVLLAGLAVAVAGFMTGTVGFGLSLAVCFLIWIGGALLVNRRTAPHLSVRGGGAAPPGVPDPPQHGLRDGSRNADP